MHNSTSLTPNPPTNTTPPPDKIIRIPMLYIPTLFTQLKNAFKSIPIVQIVPHYKKTIGNLFTKLKDKTKKDFLSNVIYEVTCKTCPCKYIGQTKQYISKRLATHKRDCDYFKDATALSNHTISTGHKFDFDNYRILNHESNYYKRIFKEMIFINKEQNSINFQTDINNLNNIYVNLIQQI